MGNPVTIRFAREEDGPAIGKLFRESEVGDYGVDWTKPVRGWLVAEEDGELIGALQAIAGSPMAMIGDLVVARRIRGLDRSGRGRLGRRPGAVGFDLVILAMDYFTRIGAQVVLAMTDKPAIRHIFLRYGGKPIGDYTLFFRDLKGWPGIK